MFRYARIYAAAEGYPLQFLIGYHEVAGYPVAFYTGYPAIEGYPVEFLTGYPLPKRSYLRVWIGIHLDP